MGNERFNAHDDDEDEPTSGSGYKSSIPMPRVPKTAPLPEVQVVRNEVIVPLGPPLREQFGLKPEKPQAETDEDDDEDDDDEGSSTSKQTPAAATAEPADGEKSPVAEDREHAQVAVDEDADYPAATHTQVPPPPVARQPFIPRQRQGEMPDVVAVEPAGKAVHPEQSPSSWPQANEYQNEYPAAADMSPRDIWGTETSQPVEVGQEDDYGPDRTGDMPPTPPVKPPSESRGFAQPPEDDPVFKGGGDTQAGYSPALPTFDVSERYVAASRREYAQPIEARDRRVVPLVIGGLLFERALRRRADRKLEKRMEELSKRRHEDVLRRQDTLTEQQHEFKREQHRQREEIQRMQAVRERFQTPLAYGSERVISPYEQPATRPVANERQPLPPIVSAEQPAAAPAMQEAMPTGDEQQYNRQPHQHVEQDAWRRYVVDEHGREVVGAVTYGEAYHQERQQEVRKDPAADTLAHGRSVSASAAASVGGVIMHGTQGAYQQHSGTGSLPDGMTTPALPAGKSSHVDPQHQLAARNSMRSNITNPWFWLMLALIVAAFFTAALI